MKRCATGRPTPLRWCRWRRSSSRTGPGERTRDAAGRRVPWRRARRPTSAWRHSLARRHLLGACGVKGMWCLRREKPTPACSGGCAAALSGPGRMSSTRDHPHHARAGVGDDHLCRAMMGTPGRVALRRACTMLSFEVYLNGTASRVLDAQAQCRSGPSLPAVHGSDVGLIPLAGASIPRRDFPTAGAARYSPGGHRRPGDARHPGGQCRSCDRFRPARHESLNPRRARGGPGLGATDHGRAQGVGAVHLEPTLREVQPDRGNLYLDGSPQWQWSATATLQHANQGAGPSTPFNGKPRDQPLNETLFTSLAHARGAVAAWAGDDNA